MAENRSKRFFENRIEAQRRGPTDFGARSAGSSRPTLAAIGWQAGLPAWLAPLVQFGLAKAQGIGRPQQSLDGALCLRRGALERRVVPHGGAGWWSLLSGCEQ